MIYKSVDDLSLQSRHQPGLIKHQSKSHAIRINPPQASICPPFSPLPSGIALADPREFTLVRLG